MLAGLVAGQAAQDFEGLGEGQAVQQVMQLLNRIFEPQGVPVPEPLQVRGGCGRDGVSLGFWV